MFKLIVYNFKFVPLHERLNNEMKQNTATTESDDDEEKEDDILAKTDPYYINETLLQTEEESLDETQKQVN